MRRADPLYEPQDQEPRDRDRPDPKGRGRLGVGPPSVTQLVLTKREMGPGRWKELRSV